jgi:biotin transport system substrate-specific component
VRVDDWCGRRGVVTDAFEVIGFSLVTALLARLRIPLPFTPVPITGQTLGVLLAGATLGARRGFLSQVLYILAGAAGLHVFAGGSLAGPTAGYLWSFPLAALLVGWLVDRGAARRTSSLTAALVLADSCIMASGVLWLSTFVRITIRQALGLGFMPFWEGEVLKIVMVALLLPLTFRSTPLDRLPRQASRPADRLRGTNSRLPVFTDR